MSSWSSLQAVRGEEPKPGPLAPTLAGPEAQPPVAPSDKPPAEKLPVSEAKAASPMLFGAPPVNKPAEAPLAVPASASPPGAPDAAPASSAPVPEANDKAVHIKFNFRFHPWEDVLNWFAQQAGFSLVMNAAPPGTFNYSDDRSYTPAEAIDLLNGVLLTKGYTLVLRDRMLMLVNLEDGIPPNLVSTVPTTKLDDRGEFELLSSLFQLENLRPEEAEAEIKKLLGPQGAVIVLPKSQQLLITETAGRLRMIREVIQRADNPEAAGTQQVQWFEVPAASSEEVLGILRQMFNIPAGQNATADGSFRMAWDPASLRLLVAAQSGKLTQVNKILQAYVPPGSAGATAATQSTPQLEVYEVYPADPDSTLKVLQTLLAGSAGVRLTADPKTGSLIALARPNEHATIRATIEQMRRDAQQVEVLQLRITDPQTAAQSIQKLFGTDAKAPAVQADVATRQLMVRGSQAQIEQVRSMLEKMGETELTTNARASGDKVRMLPLTGHTARSILDRMEEIWPQMHRNQIRVVTPSAVIPTLRWMGAPDAAPESGPEASPPPPLPFPAPPGADQAPANPAAPAKTTTTTNWARVVFVADAPAAKTEAPASPAQPVRPSATAQESPPILVAPGPGGLVIASEDIKALDEFETMLRTLAGTTGSGAANLTIFYLKFVKANAVAETLDRVLGGGTLPKEIYQQQQQQQQAMGGMPGMPGMPGMFGMMGRGMPGMPTSTATPPQNPLVQITPDARLNALIVRAGPADLETIEELLKILDQRESPEEILAQPKPRLVPVHNTQADEIVTVLKQVYSDRIGTSSSSGSSGGGSNPFAMMFRMRGMRGMPGGGGGSSSSSSRSSEDAQKMSLGVDSRTNSVIVSAPEPLFEEVRQFIEQLDDSAIEANQTMRVVTLHRASLEAVEQALSSLGGDSVQVNRTVPSAQPSAGSQPMQSMGGARSTTQRSSSYSRSQTGSQRSAPRQTQSRASGSRSGSSSRQMSRPNTNTNRGGPQSGGAPR
jgi:type II secretory pathway component GspD/PulD (secretin)